MDAVTLLRQDHKTVEGLFKKFEKAAKADNTNEQRRLRDKIVEELAIHAAIEEQVFYPAVREASEEVEDTVLESLEEHHVVKWTLSELDGMDPAEERFKAKMTVLIESVRHHVEEEEGELFPQVREAIKRKQLTEMANALQAAKKVAPTRPHPRAPDTPPANLVAGAGAGIVDKARKAGKDAVKKATRRQ